MEKEMKFRKFSARQVERMLAVVLRDGGRRNPSGPLALQDTLDDIWEFCQTLRRRVVLWPFHRIQDRGMCAYAERMIDEYEIFANSQVTAGGEIPNFLDEESIFSVLREGSIFHSEWEICSNLSSIYVFKKCASNAIGPNENSWWDIQEAAIKYVYYKLCLEIDKMLNS